jgi:hypothetical protein
MPRTPGIIALSLTFLLALSAGVRAQSAAPDTAAAQEKKGGLFGKAKKFVGDKTVQQVAKTVACTMVPGGQAIAGAIDAASSESVGDAAAGAAGAAVGQTCIPAPAVTGNGAGGGMPGLPGMSGLAGEVAAQAGVPGATPTVVQAGSMGYGAMPGMGSPAETAACMGLTEEEYLDFTDPTRGQARPMTKDEMKRQGKLAKKVDMASYQSCLMAER